MLVLFLTLLTTTLAVKFKFELDAGKTQCFHDDLPNNVLVYGNVYGNSSEYIFTIYEIINGEEQKLDSEENYVSFDFHHVLEREGRVMMCFEAKEYVEPMKIQFQYDSGSETHDFDMIANKGHFKEIQGLVDDMETTMLSISREQKFIIQHEVTRNHAYVDVSTKIIGFGLITFSMLLVVAACQIMYIKRYFAYKKII